MASNFKINKSNESLPYVVVLMVSRNKDNKDLKDFKERRWSYFTRKDLNKIKSRFKQFVDEGLKEEVSRLYISLNPRKTEGIREELMHLLIDKKDFDFANIEPIIASIAAHKEYAIENNWFFDFDVKKFDMLQEFVSDIKKDYDGLITIKDTPNGYSVIVSHGFDTRNLMSKWSDKATLKRDDLILYEWSKK